MRAIVMAGGFGRRLQPYTKDVPKPLLPLDGTPVLEVILRQLRSYGFTKVTLAVHYRAGQIREYFGDGSSLDMTLDYSWADRPLGTAGPLGLVPRPDQACLVLNSDLLTTVDFADVLAAHHARRAMGTVVLCRHSIPIDFGVVDLRADMTVQAFREKPTQEHWISAGIYAVEPDVWDHIPAGEYLDMPTLIAKGVQRGYAVAGYLHHGEWLDIGTADQYRRAQEVFRARRRLFLPHDDGTREPVGSAPTAMTGP
jgi:NDP-sugar pyrophosphorylase family protein